MLGLEDLIRQPDVLGPFATANIGEEVDPVDIEHPDQTIGIISYPGCGSLTFAIRAQPADQLRHIPISQNLSS